MKSNIFKEIQLQLFNKLLCFTFILSFAFLSGCYVVEFLTPAGPPSDKQLFENYDSVELMTSNAADVLVQINLPEQEILSQSKSIIASSGEKKKGYRQWMNMVAFNEDSLTAERKYLFFVDERPKAFFAKPWERLSFDCQLVLDEDILNKPYANENAYRIGIIEHISDQFTNDVKQVSSDNEVIYTSQMLVNQAFNTILQRLQSSPSEASLLSTSEGLKFDHISFDKGKIWMAIDQKTATIDLQMGSLVKKRLEVTDKLLEYKSGNERKEN
ncbi:MAG: hypothetical protein ACYTE8_04820 [Planctomycetota bacterium]|jgi:hypothetical protein